MTDVAKITAVPLHDWTIHAVYRVSVDEAATLAGGSPLGRALDEIVRYEGPNCLVCGVDYEPGGSDECTARERVETTVEF